MCQMLANSDANLFACDASRQSCKKRPLATEEKLGSSASVSSPSSVDASHYNLRIKRARTAKVGLAFSQASPCSTSAKVKTRPHTSSAFAPVSVSRDLNGEVKTLQRKVLQMQEQVKDAADGIRQLRQLVGVLVMQRRRAAMLARAQSVEY